MRQKLTGTQEQEYPNDDPWTRRRKQESIKRAKKVRKLYGEEELRPLL